ncbi:hypothetical protein ON010_g13348 [Phytophthora cinnamomi]|nr:hypothetical protein ON010_g13348 [Phytophthora cinnamomi]
MRSEDAAAIQTEGGGVDQAAPQRRHDPDVEVAMGVTNRRDCEEKRGRLPALHKLSPSQRTHAADDLPHGPRQCLVGRLGQAPVRRLDNALYGFLKLSPYSTTWDVFEDGKPEAPGILSVLGRRSYIHDILIGGTSWDDLCEKGERLLDVCERWHLSTSVEKSEWGISRVDYLGHKVSKQGRQAKPKNLESLTTLEFPRTLKGLQSFLSCLNYNHRFIADFAIYATALYSLAETEFDDYVARPEVREQERWIHATRAFDALKTKFGETPMLKHFDASREPVVIPYNARLATPIQGTPRPTLAMGRGPFSIEVRDHLLHEGREGDPGHAGHKHHAPNIRRYRSKVAVIPVPVVMHDEELHVMSFDGSAKGKREGDAFSAVVWQLPGWEVRARNALQAWPHHELFHVRRDWNASADILAGQALQRQGGRTSHGPDEIQDLKTLNRLGEVIRPLALSPEAVDHADPVAVDPGTDNHVPDQPGCDGIRPSDVDAGCRTAPVLANAFASQQDEEAWIANLKKYLSGDLGGLSRREAKDCQKIARQYEEGEGGFLYYYGRGDESTEDRDTLLKLVIPETLRDDVLRHYHASLEGGHQGKGRTYQ